MTGPGVSLRTAAVGWIAWATINRVIRDTLRIGGRLLLARLLFPEAFGLYTLAATIVVGLQTICQFHFQSLLIRRATLTPTLIATAYWSQIAIGALGTLTLLAGADLVGALVGDRRVVPVLQLLSVQLLLGGLSAVPRAWLLRRLDFRQLAYRTLVCEGIGIAVAVAAAHAGAGVWSLVIQDLVVAGLDVVVFWSLMPWRLERRWGPGEFRELYQFGSPLVAAAALQYMADQGDRLLVGRGFGSSILGHYAVASRLVEIISEGPGVILRQVAFPAFSRAQHDLKQTARGFLEAAKFHAIIVFPLFLGAAVLADIVVPLVLGSLWAIAIPFVRVLAARALLNSLAIVPRALLLARGRQWLLLRLGVLNLAACTLGWLLGFPWGALGIAAGTVAAALVMAIVTVRMAVVELSIDFTEWMGALAAPAAGALAMAAGMIIGPRLVPELWPTQSVLRVAALLVLGGSCYVLPVAPWLIGEIRRQRQQPASAFTITDDVEPLARHE